MDNSLSVRLSFIIERDAITLETRFLWDSITPFELPVVPDVYNIAAKSSSFTKGKADSNFLIA